MHRVGIWALTPAFVSVLGGDQTFDLCHSSLARYSPMQLVKTTMYLG